MGVTGFPFLPSRRGIARMSPNTKVVFVRHRLHALMGNLPLDARPGAPPCPPTMFHPSDAGLRCLRTADVVVAEDTMDPAKTVTLKAPDADAPDPPDGAPLLGVRVELDFDDADELPWLKAALMFADAGVSAVGQSLRNDRPRPAKRKKK